MEYIIKSDKVILTDGGAVKGELDYPITDGIAEMNHTFVDEGLRGQGIAGELMKRAVEYLRAEGVKVIPTCSFAVKWFEKNESDRDILKTN